MGAKTHLLERLADRALDTGLGSVWSRLGPLSAGAVASSTLIVGGAAIVRRAARSSHRLGLLGAAALVPVGLWVLRHRGTDGSGEGNGEDASDLASGSDATAGRDAADEGDAR